MFLQPMNFANPMYDTMFADGNNAPANTNTERKQLLNNADTLLNEDQQPLDSVRC